MTSNATLGKALLGAGLSEKEAEVYLALVAVGSGTVYRIAEQCGLKRPTVYLILEDLRKKGLALKIPHAKKAIFSANDIEEYLHERRKELAMAESFLPQFRSISENSLPKVYFFNGPSGIKEAFDYKLSSMKGRTFYSFYGNFTHFEPRLLKIYSSWDQKAFDQYTAFKIITAETSHNYTDVMELHGRRGADFKVKYLKNYPYPEEISIEVGEDFVRTTNAKALYSTVIDDRTMADAMREIFKVVWAKEN